MPIKEHPETGAVLICDFGAGFRMPEIDKRRPVVVLSPKIRNRHQLCTVASLSTTAPRPVMPYHCQIDLRPQLPAHFRSDGVWVKGDMVKAVGFHRLDFIRLGKNAGGKRVYLYQPLTRELVRKIRMCVLHAMGMGILTRHL